MQSDLFDAPAPAPNPRDDRTTHLHNQLVKLGDMLGDGMGDEPDGAWIKKEYRRVCKALGYGPPRRNNSEAINKRMAERVAEQACSNCGGTLKQTRSGSMKGRCTSCGEGFTLLKIAKRKKSNG
jgi:hypothetical protein